MKIAWMLSGMMALGQIVNPGGGGGGGGNPSVGTAGQIQKAGSTTGTFAASSLTDNGTEMVSSEVLSFTGCLPAMVVGSITSDFCFGNTGRIIATNSNGAAPNLQFLLLTSTGAITTALTLSALGNAVFFQGVTAPGFVNSTSGTVSATAGTGVTSVTCVTAACTTERGTYTIVGGTATTGTIATLTWPSTTTPWACSANMNGGTSFLGIGHSLATATGMNITAGVAVTGLTLTVDYSCRP